MSDGWNKDSGIDQEKAKQFQAGALGGKGILDNFKSAWLNLKTGLGLSDEKEKPAPKKSED